jgi:ATP-dependent DNA ligase
VRFRIEWQSLRAFVPQVLAFRVIDATKRELWGFPIQARAVDLPVNPPVLPMLAKRVSELPAGDDWIYEPKWDGFRVLFFRDGDEVYLQSRDSKPLNRYFPEVVESVLRTLPERCVLDGELVVATRGVLDFDTLQQRVHPAASRVKLLSQQTPASVVFFDLLSLGDRDLRALPFEQRRAELEQVLAGVAPPMHITPATLDRGVAADWFRRFEGAGLDGVIAKPEGGIYEPGKRAMVKVKHARTAECVVAGFRWLKDGKDERVGSLLLGLYDRKKQLQHVGVTSAFSMATRRELVKELAPLRTGAMQDHPWREWAQASGEMQRMPGAQSRWSAGKDPSWEPLRIEQVCEVKYDHMQGDRFRHAAIFLRWRPDKQPKDCTYDQLEVVTPYELAKIFRTRAR